MESERGKGSGYLCRLDSKKISLGIVLRTLAQEPVSMNWHSGDMDRDCLISSGMGAVMDGIYRDLNVLCMEHLDMVTLHDLENELFTGKESPS